MHLTVGGDEHLFDPRSSLRQAITSNSTVKQYTKIKDQAYVVWEIEQRLSWFRSILRRRLPRGRGLFGVAFVVRWGGASVVASVVSGRVDRG
jgi:hypothetical protein